MEPCCGANLCPPAAFSFTPTRWHSGICCLPRRFSHLAGITRGIPIGFDARKVVANSALPVIDIMMGHRKPGVGMIGMGVVSPPMKCFEDAVQALDLVV